MYKTADIYNVTDRDLQKLEGDFVVQVNRLSLGLQEELKSVTNYNTARSETLFENVNADKRDFSNLNVEDLNITEDKIATLLTSFADEIVSVFGSGFSFISKNNADNTNNINPEYTKSPDVENRVKPQDFIA